MENANISDDKIAEKYYKFFNERKNRIIHKQEQGYPPLKTVESEAANAGFYFGALDDMYQFLSDYNRYDITKIRENNYAVIIKQLKDYFQQIPNNKPNNKKPETDSSIPSFPVSIPKDLLPRNAEAENLYNGISKNRFFNLVGVGGGGKTSLTYLMMQKHKDDFNEIAYVAVNNNIKDDFVKQINLTLNLRHKNGEGLYKKIIAFLEENYKSDKPNLLVLDINETTKETDNKKFIDELHVDNWHVLILSQSG